MIRLYGCIILGTAAGLIVFAVGSYVALTQFDCSSLIDHF